ncbi:hypothetical protein ABZ946_37065 [Streptomyces sp. NPDC046324]|uniref:hypothetical protein n=1 Tax=Streptomyces sp. NPDC046324 TaxID=3154915 RepID=UPI0033C71C56
MTAVLEIRTPGAGRRAWAFATDRRALGAGAGAALALGAVGGATVGGAGGAGVGGAGRGARRLRDGGAAAPTRRVNARPIRVGSGHATDLDEEQHP